MKRKQKKGKDRSEDWSRVAELFEGEDGLGILRASRALTAIERRRLLGAGTTRLVSIRVPEDDLVALKAIAETHERKYQQLMVQAIELFLDQYQQMKSKLKKASSE